MKKLIECADNFILESDWKDIALIKLCICSLGIIIGLCIPKEKKKVPLCAAVSVFAATYVPLIMKFGKVAADVYKNE